MKGFKPSTKVVKGSVSTAKAKSSAKAKKDMEQELAEEVEPVQTLVDGQYALWVLEEDYRYCGVRVTWSWDRAIIGDVSVYIGTWSRDLWEVKPTIGRYAVLHAVVGEIDSALIDAGVKLPSFRWRVHQIGEGYRLWERMERLGWALVMHMPRTGKTGTVLYALELYTTMKVLIVTTKNGVRGIGSAKSKAEGWLGFIETAQESGWLRKHNYTLTTPHRVAKILDSAGSWDMVVVDEAHKIYSDPKPTDRISRLWEVLRYVVANAKVMFVTATPHAQSINQLYWMLGLSSYSPFYALGMMTFEDYFSAYGIPKSVAVGNGVGVPVWTKGKVKEVYEVVRDGVLSLSQEEVGFNSELLPVDIPCYVELGAGTTAMISEYVSKEVIKVGGTMVHTMNASDVPMRIHQMEGGTLKYVDVFSITDKETGYRRRDVKPKVYNWFVGSMEKVAYIKERWGDSSDVVIMYHYVNEGKLLRREFKNAKVLQGKTHSEAIDLYMYDTMVIYSMDYSVATYVQRRDRQVHLTKRVKPIEVYYLLCKGMVSAEIYKSVVEKGEDLTYSKYGKL